MDSSDAGAVQPSYTDMKRPKTSDWMESSPPPKSHEGQEEEEDEEDEEERRMGAGLKAKRERRQGSGSATVCQVCNIQLNSSAQAQIHYRGKTHQRRLRRLAKAVSAGALSQNQVHPLLGSLPMPGRSLQQHTHAQLEHFLPLRVNGSSPLSLFPNFNTMDPVQKAVINHTFGMTPPKKKPIISCNICHLRFNSTTQAEAHYKGHKHARKLKALETQRNRQKNGQSQSISSKDRDRDKGVMGGVTGPTDSQSKDKTGPVTSSTSAQQQMEISKGSSLAATPSSQTSSTDCSLLASPHLSPHVSPGSQSSDLPSNVPHVEGCSSATSSAPQSEPQGSSTGGEEETVKVEEVKESKSNKKHLHCPTCKVTVNSSSQLEAHCSGSKHKQMLDGQNTSQPQRRVKMTSSSRPACRIKQRMGSKARPARPVGVNNQPFHCELCQVSVNSESQLKQHMNSRRHKERLAGKPVKAKFTPYNKLQPSAVLATKLALQKQLSKALPPGFLTSPLNPAALCAMASGPLALRLPPGPTAIIQGPLISPTLFRPAPGPLRATHAPIIFSPY
ncbi:zinc finger protein 385B-like isoform X1 [Pundamilia nyererei]|uniref:Zinc finger protein 385B-like isoform X1 n=3 Tax=Haplochromini TaxID=319058 RepID=A0A9Y3RY83_9CICH|nr:zinc finger protein 385B isoform X1 [Maylandia zebra]XP_005749284.1 PREDICTED: zinc finger protein 385B-like isoform X1 [Pundamilia nyererei]XP_026034449.1 zinc finger protein 385B-like isoform X1 [Astatotilapia calliptera]